MRAPLNNQYGNGIYRRRIRLERQPGMVDAALEDDYHAFRIQLHHDGTSAQAIVAQALRFPGSTCSEAVGPLQAFSGKPLTRDRQKMRDYGDRRHHCSHLYDLLWLAMSHALRDTPSRQYDITVPDMKNGSTDAELLIDGGQVLCWTTDQSVISAPEEMAGCQLASGFGKWVERVYDGEELEAAYVLQMGIFVASSRRYDGAVMVGKPIALMGAQPGACYTFQPENSERSRRLDNIRDFTDLPGRLLEFF